MHYVCVRYVTLCPACLQCHAPNAAIQKKTKLDAQPSFNEGVNCIACHTIQGFKGIEGEEGKLRLGTAAYDISKTSLQAPSGKHYTTTPGVEGHEEASNSSVTCQACHMPVVNGRISHNMMGGHDAATVKRGVVMTLKVDKADAKLKAKIDLKNQLPHNFPTGAPFRNVYLQLTAHDAKGVEVWKNYTTHPLKDDKQGICSALTPKAMMEA
ncbi:cytochrome c family protein [Thiothrix winogradskyi]|uniref:Cytochrome c family protein n=1 Tax=Thiothrix winogradskyi TaxID=96472 RepID=A0ABY3SZ68_9GAMM|nr:cytochrome c family protein [Thiothrix winogradskyi]UJS24847.1 cytochrome c family protein [Thiothrix winogradskyi]